MRTSPSILLTCVLTLGLAACAGSLESGSEFVTQALPESAIQAVAAGNCQRLRDQLSGVGATLGELNATARTQVDSTPTSLIATLQRLNEPRGAGLPAVAQFDKEVARYMSLSREARLQACDTADIDTKMQEAVARMNAFKMGG